ncbi:MAG: DUF3991 and toprim domain-containing protein [Oscillospiraceae bacterium]|jgi:hypothetical protein|nr:DUF3991 and toprim domain-containing protein [Oscillospiraceae bacterium]
MPGVSREQIDRAKQVNILDYVLAYEPDNLRRIGSAYYLKDHGSLEISNGLWNWHSRDIGGKNVVDYLIKVRGFSFVDAVRHLAGSDVSHSNTAPKARLPDERKAFALPPRNKGNERAIAYLQGRGIDTQAIRNCISNGSLYESARWHNAIFVGRDENGNARYASIRGTIGDFKRDADGSDKRFGFVLPPKYRNSDIVATFESPVDALSHQSLCPEFGGWRLSLGCTALAALENFLERHREIKSVVACTDNDKAGNMAAAKISKLPNITVTRSLPPNGNKDWNDAIMSIKLGEKPSLIGLLEDAKVTAAGLNALAVRKKAGDPLCL